jgi:hypothetical protein
MFIFSPPETPLQWGKQALANKRACFSGVSEEDGRVLVNELEPYIERLGTRLFDREAKP